MFVMIKSFKHKGLQIFFEFGITKGIQHKHSARLRMQLAALDTAQTIDDMDISGVPAASIKRGKKRLLVY